MVKPSRVKTDDITSAMIARAHKVYDCQRHEYFYQIENSRDLRDIDGNLIEYAVRYSHDKGFTCECMSGQNGFYNTRHGYCQHVAIAMAATKEDKAKALAKEIEPICDVVEIVDGWVVSCQNNATHFDTEACEFRCDCHNGEVAKAAPQGTTPLVATLINPATMQPIGLKVVATVPTSRVMGTLNGNKGFSLLRSA